MTTAYRPHIDGLRAIAVGGVIAYHLELFPVGHFALPGGFTGVDVFFVISGFLISRIIFEEALGDRFTFAQFYNRRAKRILPALVVASSLTMAAGSVFLHPSEYQRLSNSFLAALGFCANVYYYITSDYFGPAASDLPLLHLWSLGVEEQFYLLFPAFALLLTKMKLRWRVVAILVSIGASLAASQYYVRNDQPAAFYLLQYRAFELLMGSLIALPGFRQTNSKIVAEAAAFSGLIAIAWSYHYVDSHDPFPGAMALPACLGATLLIWAGESHHTLVTRGLSFPPTIWVGRLSYSLYLYHWPLLFFINLLNPKSPCNPWLVLGLTLFASILSYFLVESPFRRLRWRPLSVISLSVLTVLFLATVGTFISATGGMAWRVDAQINHYLSYGSHKNFRQYRSKICFMEHYQSFQDLAPNCLAPSNEKPIALIWGDSGIAMYASELDKAATENGYAFRQATASACPPAIGLDPTDRPHCKHFNENVLKAILDIRPALVILGAAWPAGTAAYDGAEKSIQLLREADIPVTVLGIGPAYHVAVPTILANRLRDGIKRVTSGNDLQDEWLLKTDEMLRTRVQRYPGVRYVSIFKTVCPHNECPLLVGGVPIHSDLYHVTEDGAALFVSMFKSQIFTGRTNESGSSNPHN